MEAWHIWIIIALLLFIVEIFTSGFAVFCISVGAVFAAISYCIGFEFEGQLIWFLVATLISFVMVRPLMVKYFYKRSKEVLTNKDSLIGRVAIVSERIDARNNSGRVKIDGDVWRAITVDCEIVKIGEKIVVEQINSTILIVKKL